MRARSDALVALGASLVVAAAAIGTFAWAAPRDQVPTGFRAFLSADAGPEVLGVSPADMAATGPVTSTSSQSGLLSSIAGIPNRAVAGSVILAADALGSTDAVQILRSMSSAVTTDGTISTTFYVALVDDAGLLKSAEMGSGGLALWYSPPMVELPAGVTVGSTWVGNGTVNDVARYEAEGAVEAGETDDCIQTVMTTRLIIDDADPIVTRLRTTWCLGRGATLSVNLDTGLTVRVLTDIPVASLPDATPPSVPTYTVPAALPFLSPSVSRPAIVSGDVLILTNSFNQDMAAIPLAPPKIDPDDAPLDLSVLPIAWMQHPGGGILGLSSDGQNSYIVTTSRAVISLDRAGGLRWRATTPDVAAGAPVVLDDIVVVATVDGSMLAFDRLTGGLRWSRTMSDAVVAAPVSTGETVVVADIAGQVSAINSAGESVWTVETDGVTSPISAFEGGSLLIVDDSGAAHLIGRDGADQWSTGLASSPTGTAALTGNIVVVPTKVGLQGLSLTNGDDMWHDDTWTAASVWTLTDGVYVTEGDRLAGVGADGTVTDVGSPLIEPDGEQVVDSQLVELSGTPVIVTSFGSLLPWPANP